MGGGVYSIIPTRFARPSQLRRLYALTHPGETFCFANC